jgi:hypothetical protein
MTLSARQSKLMYMEEMNIRFWLVDAASSPP